jgi:hypothetical protein
MTLPEPVGEGGRRRGSSSSSAKGCPHKESITLCQNDGHYISDEIPLKVIGAIGVVHRSGEQRTAPCLKTWSEVVRTRTSEVSETMSEGFLSRERKPVAH